MTVGSWEPDSDNQTISTQALKSALRFDDEHAFPSDPPTDVLPLQPFAKTTQSVWKASFETLSNDELKQLCRFFTLAEARWSDWFGGDKNPVIWICKELKTRGQFPDKDLTAWIKKNTENRFLPYGNVLG